MKLKISTFHGEGQSLFHVVDADAPSDEQPAVLFTGKSLEEAALWIQRADVLRILAEAIREGGRIPSGHLYAMMMPACGLNQYETAIKVLKDAQLVAEENHVLRWRGPVHAVSPFPFEKGGPK